MKVYPGNESFGNDSVPFNVMSNDTLLKTLTDRGSLPTAMSATLLGYMQNEDNATLISALDENGSSTLDNKRLIHAECDLGGIFAIFGCCVFLGSTYKFQYDTATLPTWHRCRTSHGLYKNNAAGSGGSGDNTNVSLTDTPTLINNNFTVASVAGITDKDVGVGVEVGGEQFGQIYHGVVDALVVVGSNSNFRNVSLYKSDDNRVWSPVVKSTYSSNGFNSGEKAIANFRGSGVTGNLFLFNEPTKSRYFKAVQTGTPAGAWDLYECLALNLQGEIRYSDDLNQWNGAIRDTTYSDYLLFKFEDARKEVRAVEFYFDPFQCESTKTTRVDIDHVEIYADTAAVDFGIDGLSRIYTITDGELGTVGDSEQIIIRNDATRIAKKFYAHIPIGKRTVTALAMTAGGTTFQLSDSSKRIDYARYILNAAGTAIGAFGDSSVVCAGGMAAWTEVASGPSGNQYSVNYSTGVITTDNDIPVASTVSFTYASPGAAATEFSVDNATWYGPGYGNRKQLASTGVSTGSTAYMYVRSQLTNFTQTVEDVIRTALLMIEAMYQGE